MRTVLIIVVLTCVCPVCSRWIIPNKTHHPRRNHHHKPHQTLRSHHKEGGRILNEILDLSITRYRIPNGRRSGTMSGYSSIGLPHQLISQSSYNGHPNDLTVKGIANYLVSSPTRSVRKPLSSLTRAGVIGNRAQIDILHEFLKRPDYKDLLSDRSRYAVRKPMNETQMAQIQILQAEAQAQKELGDEAVRLFIEHRISPLIDRYSELGRSQFFDELYGIKNRLEQADRILPSENPT